MFADWQVGRAEVRGPILRAFLAIKRFFAALRQAMKGEGYTTADQVFRRVAKGDVGRRGQPRDAQGRFTGSAMASRAEGEPVATLTGDEMGAWSTMKELRARLVSDQSPGENHHQPRDRLDHPVQQYRRQGDDLGETR